VKAAARTGWVPIAILGSAQFVMVLDSSVMNVSISQIVADLDTTIQGVQLAITAYTLVMAAFMLVGARLGDIWGRDRAFALGLAVYGAGSLTTALSPNLGVLLIGWSLVEGLGAVLVVPAIASLIAANYEGKERALAYGVVGGIAAAAVAAGPLIGGWVTTAFTWRLVFAGEVVIVVVILLLRHRMRPSPRPSDPPSLDVVGAALSASGLALIVFAILQSSTWGLILPKGSLEIAGRSITPLGFSVVPFLILGGLGILWLFAIWEDRVARRGGDRLLDIALLRIEHLRAGLSTLLVQQLVLLGTFFVLPVYLQVVLGLDAFETGKKLIPMSAAMLVAALSGPRLAARMSPRAVAQIGLVAVAVAGVILLGTLDVELNSVGFAVGLVMFGIGAGLLASQLGNVIMSSVDPADTNEAGGLQGTAQNLGASLGTALIGAILLIGMTSAFVDEIADDQSLPVELRTALTTRAETSGLDVVPVAEVEAAALAAGLPADQASAVADHYGNAQLDGLRQALGAVAMFALLGLWFTRRLPVAFPAPGDRPALAADHQPDVATPDEPGPDPAQEPRPT
jgi:MFS family permease